ncbi:phage baseplate protein [Citrobacter sp. OP27]
MPQEQATVISELQPDWPLGTDPESQGDDHIRMIKQVIQNTFPALNGVVTGTPTKLNNCTEGFKHLDADETYIERFSITSPTDTTKGIALQCSTPTADQYITNPSMVVTWRAIQDLVYPVGTVLVRAHSDNPAVYLGFGTWVARQGSIYGAGTLSDAVGMSGSVGAGKVNGNWRIQNSMLAAATLNLAMDAVSPHTHTYSLRDGANPTSATQPDNGGHNLGTGNTGSAGGHTPTGKVTIGTGTPTSGAAHYAPGYAFYVWERTA